MTKTVWHKGPPPEIGWWPASVNELSYSIRWWDGDNWSMPARPEMSASVASRISRDAAHEQKQIEWAERWWL